MAGRGLVQWTPGTKLLSVLDILYGKHDDWWDGGKQCAVLFAEYQESVGDADRGIEPEWYPTSSYNMTWREWATGNYDLKTLTNAFMYNYLRPASLNQPERYTYAQYWSSVFIKGDMMPYSYEMINLFNSSYSPSTRDLTAFRHKFIWVWGCT